jgi:hypothetical protein
MRGVYNVTGSGQTTEQGTSYDAVFGSKYSNDGAVAWNQSVRRLQSWGFNTVGPYSYRMTLPVDPASTMKLPFVGSPQQAGISDRKNAAGASKNLYYGLDQTVFPYSSGANFPDVYDPAWANFVASAYATNADLAVYKTSPYFIGMFSDDTDFLAGFGPGLDFVTDPVGKYHAHLGAIALVTAPTQATNPYASNVAYTHTEVYSKTALKNFLTTRYGTIGALNIAWGSNYTTFASSGGWPTGSGLLDENGRASHTWLGTNSSVLIGASAAVKRDLDDFLFELAETYFTVNREAFKAIAPNALFFGPTNLGGAGWRAPARGPILKAAGQYLDVVNIGTDGSQAQLDFVASWAGDVPVAIWEGVVANSDSGRWRSKSKAASWNVASQLLRGRQYERDVQALLLGRTAGPAGSRPYVGLLFWAWADSFKEAQNWGLVSLRDNAYDGREATRVLGRDPWGYLTGGEERDYGDFISSVRRANFAVFQTLIQEGRPEP